MPFKLGVLTSNPHPHRLVWVDAKRLDQLLAREYLVSAWTGGASPMWFWPRDDPSPTTFFVAEIYLRDEDGEVDVMVPNGRHRIRWLIGRGDTEIPVSMNVADEPRARSLGLLLRAVEPGDVLP